MEQPEILHRLRVDRHVSTKEVITHVGNAKDRYSSALMDGIQLLGRWPFRSSDEN